MAEICHRCTKRHGIWIEHLTRFLGVECQRLTEAELWCGMPEDLKR